MKSQRTAQLGCIIIKLKDENCGAFTPMQMQSTKSVRLWTGSPSLHQSTVQWAWPARGPESTAKSASGSYFQSFRNIQQLVSKWLKGQKLSISIILSAAHEWIQRKQPLQQLSILNGLNAPVRAMDRRPARSSGKSVAVVRNQKKQQRCSSGIRMGSH